MSARKYATLDDLATLESRIVQSLAAVLAGTPAQAAPTPARAEAPVYVSDKAPCAVHAAGTCTRKLSNPEGDHLACMGAGDPNHDKLRKSHRHF